jgi:uncharacterized iron-regulated membrane protein
MASVLWRVMVVTHRYLGVVIGLLMLMWFVSGIVMMYVPYPRISEAERLGIASPISWQACCRFGEGTLGDNQQVLRAQIESHLGTPALRLRAPGQLDTLVDLAQGARVAIDADTARKAALEALPRILGKAATIVAEDKRPIDQWTIGRYFRDRPLYRFDLDDADRTILYVSGTTGNVVVWITQMQRFWNWIGTIPHFLYFVDLRVNGPLWSQTVIWTSLVGTFLTVVGLVLGIAQFKRGSGGRLSPYRGWFYWHHVAGLVFGIVTLTWVMSGLFSMNPWGFLESRSRGEASLVLGPAIKGSEIKASLEALHMRPLEANVVSLTSAPLAGRLYWLATYQDGTVKRLDAAGNVTPPSTADLAAAAERIAGGAGIAEQGMMQGEDDYYFSRRRRDDVTLPAYRVILNDEEQTRYYLSPETGELLARADATNRMSRWLFSGLHHINFFEWLRWRPLWDVVVLTLMLGGLGVTATGCWLAIRRIRSDVAMLFRWRRRSPAPEPTMPSNAPSGVSGAGWRTPTRAVRTFTSR